MGEEFEEGRLQHDGSGDLEVKDLCEGGLMDGVVGVEFIAGERHLGGAQTTEEK